MRTPSFRIFFEQEKAPEKTALFFLKELIESLTKEKHRFRVQGIGSGKSTREDCRLCERQREGEGHDFGSLAILVDSESSSPRYVFGTTSQRRLADDKKMISFSPASTLPPARQSCSAQPGSAQAGGDSSASRHPRAYSAPIFVLAVSATPPSRSFAPAHVVHVRHVQWESSQYRLTTHCVRNGASILLPPFLFHPQFHLGDRRHGSVELRLREVLHLCRNTREQGVVGEGGGDNMR